jgi:hypothetical protein
LKILKQILNGNALGLIGENVISKTNFHGVVIHHIGHEKIPNQTKRKWILYLINYQIMEN